ncbi:sugar phosphate isomerase/epimerase [Reichenbachiella agarivorans]|uniref:Sugar phosphate isomerase/epimerase n=1 Tax=Reichenbachiella agarivorans TaxID=2979464 RepID=A0ABY6CS77_9BACT|nr:sugar phosphate isomerase/epimerase [Reichenbachiella agarivorans]UXP33372.1 sugar phosphate isomerase/epimerase [Reichenbachiella agarivorans]
MKTEDLMKTSRRDFIKKTSLAAGLIPLLPTPLFSWDSHLENENLHVSIFSKHLQFLDYKDTGSMAAEMGFNGVDLTVRPKGHVEPMSVKADLPKAIREIEAGGSQCQMITTSIEKISNPLDVEVIQTAAKERVQYYRTNWFKYSDAEPMDVQLDQYAQQIQKLSELNQSLGIVGCYQNHAGRHVGASYWEVKKILESADPAYFGTQYDIRHAMVEGGFSWQNGLQLLQSQIKVIVLKDYKWGKVDGDWEAINVPIGQGMVDFKKYFRILKNYGLKPPVSLHLEYPLGGAEKGNRDITVDKKVVFDAMKKDLQAVQRLWNEA